MKAKRTLVFAILVLTALAWGLAPATLDAGDCAWQSPSAPAQEAAQADLPTPLALTRTGSGLECVSFCSIALCPEGTTCGPSPGGGCGCQPNGIIVVSEN